MKIIILFMASLPFSLFAENLFREVNIQNDTWEVVFHSDGTRYRIEVDGSDRGISKYLQRIELKNNEQLKLTEKHHSILVKCAQSKEGLNLAMTYRDQKSGELKTSNRFEATHGAEPTERGKQISRPLTDTHIGQKYETWNSDTTNHSYITFFSLSGR